MPKAAQGSAESPAADGSARTTQSPHKTSSADSGAGGGVRAAPPEGAESATEKSPAATSGSKAAGAADAETGVEPGPEADPKPDRKPDAKGDAKPDTGSRGPGGKPDGKSEPKNDGQHDAKTDGKADGQPGAKTDGKADEEKTEEKKEDRKDAGATGKPDATARPAPKTEAEKKPEAEGKSASGTKTEPGTQTDTATKTEPGAKPRPATGAAAPAQAQATAAANNGTTKNGTPRKGRKPRRGKEKPGASAPMSGNGTKTAVLTRTTPLRDKPVAANGQGGEAGPRTPRPSVSPGRRLSVRMRTWLRRAPRWWPVPVCLLLGAGGGAAYSEVVPAQYAAISYVVVSPSEQSEPTGALGYAQAFGKIATDPMILADAERRAGVRRGTIRQGIQATTSPDAPMVQITATSSSASQAAKNADAVAKALTHTAKASVKRTGARLTVLSQAVAPATPVSPSPAVAVGVGACAGGLLGGLALLVLPQSRRRTPYTGSPVTAGADGMSEAAMGARSTAERSDADSLTEAGR